MALPTTVSTGVGDPGHHPPIKSSGGDFYCIARRSASTDIECFKATDPTDSWTAQDSGNRPIHTGNPDGWAIATHDNIIFVINWANDSDRYEHYQFDMDTDTWTVDESMRSTSGDPPWRHWASVAVRSDGDVIVAYHGEFDENMMDEWQRTDYARREGGSWTTGQGLNNGGNNHYGDCHVVKQSDSDQMHFIYQTENENDDTPVTWEQTGVRSLDSSNNLDGQNTSNGDTAGTLMGFSNPVSYDDGGTERVVWCGYDGTDILAWMSTLDGSDDIQSPTQYTALSDDVYVNDEHAIFSLAEDEGNLYLVWSQSSDQDIYYSESTDNGQNWSTPVEILDGVTCNYISATVYDNDSGTKVIAYLYDDGGDQKYNEYSLVSDLDVDATVVNLTLSDFNAVVNATREVDGTTDALTIASQNASINATRDVDATTQGLTLNEFAAVANLDRTVDGTTQALTLTSYGADLDLDKIVEATVQALSLTSYQADVDLDKTVEATLATLNITAQNADVAFGKNVNATVQSLTIAPQNASLNMTREIDATVASLVINTFGAAVERFRDVDATSVALDIQSYAADVDLDRTVNASTASLTLASYAADLAADRNIQATTDSLTINALAAAVNATREVAGTTPALTINTFQSEINTDKNIDCTVSALTITTFDCSIVFVTPSTDPPKQVRNHRRMYTGRR